MAVKEALEKSGLTSIHVDLGEIETLENPSALQRQQLRATLKKCGLDLVENKRAVLVEKIKNVVIQFNGS